MKVFSHFASLQFPVIYIYFIQCVIYNETVDNQVLFYWRCFGLVDQKREMMEQTFHVWTDNDSESQIITSQTNDNS